MPSEEPGADVGVIAGWGRTSRRPPDDPLPDPAWRALRSAVERERLTGLMATAVADRSPFPTTDAQRAEVERTHRRAMVLAVELEHLLLEVLGSFRTSGVPARVLKGPATAHLDYPDPALRPFGDIDLLVRPDDWERVGAILNGLGGHRRYPEPRPGFDRRFTKGACFVLPRGREIDVHRTLTSGYFGLAVDLAGLFDPAESFVLAGREVTALGAERRLLSAAYHAILGSSRPRPLALRDLVELSCRPDLDDGLVVELATAWRSESVLSSALRTAWDAIAPVEQPPLVVWAFGHRVTALDHHLIGAYTGSRRRSARRALEGTLAVPGLRAKAAYLAGVAWPLETVGGTSPAERMRRAGRGLGRRRR